MRVYSYEQPVAPGRLFTPKAGMEYGVADVEYCAGTKKASYNVFDWKVQTPDNRQYSPSIGARDPSLSSGEIPPGGGCVRGFVTFEAPIGQKPAAVVFSQFGPASSWKVQ